MRLHIATSVSIQNSRNSKFSNWHWCRYIFWQPLTFATKRPITLFELKALFYASLTAIIYQTIDTVVGALMLANVYIVIRFECCGELFCSHYLLNVHSMHFFPSIFHTSTIDQTIRASWMTNSFSRATQGFSSTFCDIHSCLRSPLIILHTISN